VQSTLAEVTQVQKGGLQITHAGLQKNNTVAGATVSSTKIRSHPSAPQTVAVRRNFMPVLRMFTGEGQYPLVWASVVLC
jgi:hypothetical protein